jgi:CSLREA domain-containing protein
MRRSWLLSQLLLLAGLSPLAGVVITVETLVDADVAEGLCSLREAIRAANGDVPHRECPAGSGTDRIEFEVTGSILLSADLPEITESVDIVGPVGSGVAIDGGDLFRPFRTAGGSGFALRITRLALLRGHAADSGGCIAMPAAGDLLELQRVFFGGCSSDDDGGAIEAFAVAQTTIRDSIFALNTAGNGGGAVHAWNFGALTVEDSAFSGNQSGLLGTGSAGAILADFVDLDLRRSTVSGNSARGAGGGLVISGFSETTIESATVAGNVAGFSGASGDGGGIAIFTPNVEVTLSNTVVAGNLDGSPSGSPAADLYLSTGGGLPAVTTSGFNFIGDNASAAAFFPLSPGAGQPNANGDFVGDETAPLDPLLGALTDHGGVTPSREPLPGSPLVDQGSCAAATRDQRGYFRLETGLRVLDDPAVANFAEGCDIGAVELGATNALGSLVVGDFESGDFAAWSGSFP